MTAKSTFKSFSTRARKGYVQIAVIGGRVVQYHGTFNAHDSQVTRPQRVAIWLDLARIARLNRNLSDACTAITRAMIANGH